MATPSSAQSKLIEKLQDGDRLLLDSKTGRYVLTGLNGQVRNIDQRPVLVMLRDGLLHQDMTGQCRLS